LSNGYFAGSDTQPQRWSWNCTSVNPITTFAVDVSEFFSTASPTTTASSSFTGVSRSVTVTNMRYQPLMPYWFYQNEWYKTTFYALSPAIRPVPLVAHNCGSATSLTVGGASLDNGLVMLAGSKLTSPPAPLTQMRPSANILDYMEPTSATDFTSCIFKGPGTATTSSYNDRLLPVQ
jgi:hypothetical protein